MSAFASFLSTRLEADGFTTEDALASFLPLAREVQEAHAAGLVAPLEDDGAIQVDGVRLWFEHARRQQPRPVNAAVRRLLKSISSTVDIVSEQRVTTELADGETTMSDLSIGDRSDETPVQRPVYLPAYACWEHWLGCHDPVSDIFSLGMILASLACGLDFREEQAVETFVQHRRNLFALAPGLHPVVARAIVRMTELDRHRRPQDLASLIAALENYRHQDVDLDTVLTRATPSEATRHDKQTVVLKQLRERLFDISRRNRLLQFRPTAQSINLTQSSVPLAFDVKSIRADQILTWNTKFQRELLSGGGVSLNKYLNFVEMLFLPSQLTTLMADARRDAAEFGFAQLRLVICFLHWANLKETPAQQYDSPLLLLPVRLRKEKGIRDVYQLETLDSVAEVNPVVRYQFKQLYNIELPATLDLAQNDVNTLFDELAQRIEASDAAVKLTRIDRPQIALIHERARRKLDLYRRRARLSGAGVRSYLDLDYSYDPANYNPLGIRLFNAKVRPAETNLRTIVEETPRPRSCAVPPTDPPVVERERQFYSLETAESGNPYDWAFDLCSVTLANFRYQRMSLVRDYEVFLDNGVDNPAFDAVFSLAPRPREQSREAPRPFDERYDVVPCDPTQSSAIAAAAVGESYIIQGPPGTGKSQTITNLIADYVARGKRVLFVCEKRAAIDVVHARLRQVGLADLSCLIHDSQTDKKAFVMDLKETYAGLANLAEANDETRRTRAKAVRLLERRLAPLAAFSAAMRSTPATIGVAIRHLLDSAIALRRDVPQLDALSRERLPHYAAWQANRAAVHRFEQALTDAAGTTVCATHPLRLLAPRLADLDRPLEIILAVAGELPARLDSVRTGLAGLLDGIPLSLAVARELVDFADRVAPLAAAGRLDALQPESAFGRQFSGWRAELAQASRHLAEAEAETVHWRDKLSAGETEAALELAQAFARSSLCWLRPAWWRLRKILRQAFDFSAYRIRPTWARILEQLLAEHEAVNARQRLLNDAAGALQTDADTARDLLETLGDGLADVSPHVRECQAMLASAADGPAIVTRLCAIDDDLTAAEESLAEIADDADGWPLDELRSAVVQLASRPEVIRPCLRCLRELRAMAPAVAATLRTLPHPPRAIEAALVHHGVTSFIEADRQLAEFTFATRDQCARSVEVAYDAWLGQNAAEIRRRASAHFVEKLRICELPAARLTEQQKELKRRYNRGRRALEHEFGKQMRYRPIRDLVADESGDVVKDLKPIWLMSPLSVSDTLPLAGDLFDVAIFDEASQITLEEAVPTLFRAPQTIVVGDQMQLPPTDFFSAKRKEEEDDELLVESDGELVQYDIDADSLLSHAARNLQATMLGWHYRSRSESLISFSNRAFYDGELLTVPEVARAAAPRQPILARAATDAADGATELRRRPISFHKIAHGVYDKRRNRAEAEYIAALVRGLLDTDGSPTIGVVAFSEAQQGEIELALARLAQDDPTFGARLEAEVEREIDGQFVGLLVKNLENIQGDERDVVILSVCYGHPPEGKMLMNFGPINKGGGEKRLNVAFSRAKHHMAVVSSIEPGDITNDYNDGANCLKDYLRYAQAASVGDSEAVDRVLRELSRWSRPAPDASSRRDFVAEELTTALVERGYQVDRVVGQSHFRCDLAVCLPEDEAYRLGILIDGESYFECKDVLEREMMRPRLLRSFGWRVVHVLAKDWHEDPARELERIVRRLTDESDEGLDAADADEFDDEPEECVVEHLDPSDDQGASASLSAAANAESAEGVREARVPPLHRPAAPPTPEGASPQGATTPSGHTVCLEYRDGRSSKFWKITLSGTSHTVRYGRIGAGGRTLTKDFATEDAARRDHDRLVASKRRKGYRDSTPESDA